MPTESWRAIWLVVLTFPVSVSMAEEVVPAVPEPAGFEQPIAGLLTQFCIGCHGHDDPSGGVDLSKAVSRADIYHQGRTWNKAVRVIRDQSMPPKSEPGPADAERKVLADWIESALRDVDCSAERETGRVTIRRLNRVEYQNTIRDLLDIEIDASRDLGSDPAGNGFDNQGDTLFIPPVLMEKYVDATKRIVEAAFTQEKSRKVVAEHLPIADVTIEEMVRPTVEKLLYRAFRRPIDREEVDRRLTLVTSSAKRGESKEAGMKSVLESILLSPNFLFRIERNQAPAGSAEAYRISDHELATRLSYFLWSTMPDRELFDFADQGTLHQPEVLRVQVERMLRDPKSIALTADFASQWFGFRDMRTHEMDARRFGSFEDIRGHLYAESVAFFDHLFRENASILDVLDCRYAFVNGPLTRHYGLPAVEGDEIRKVELMDRRRGGVLGMGSTLVVTSYPTRTSPVIRGKWVLEQILGTPPPPPPPNVKPVNRDDTVKDGMTLRQRLEKHRQVESCASCHAKMDPIGFGMENYDGIGQWRDQDNGLAVDNTGTLPDGTEVRGPDGIKDALLARKELFVRQTVEKMLVYALGRGLEYYDECTIRDAMNRLESNSYRSHELIQAIAASYPFQHRKNSQE
jgi:mono/diheme cytochrome c family protein